MSGAVEDVAIPLAIKKEYFDKMEAFRVKHGLKDIYRVIDFALSMAFTFDESPDHEILIMANGTSRIQTTLGRV